MIIVWDEPKRQQNLAKHGLDFAELDERFSLKRPSGMQNWAGRSRSAN
jgi:uncharacterized DUF497 family protein